MVHMLRCIAAVIVLSLFGVNAEAATTLLPNGEQCFQTATGPVSSGSVNMYYPNTTTPKATYTNSSQSSSNTNPIQLDANGCAVIYGVGSYRQQLYTGPVVGGVTTGNLVFDLVTTDTSAYNSTFWSGLAGGTPNAITVTDAGFNATDGSVINFIPLYTNTSSTTINPSGYGTYSIVKDTSTGAVALTGGEIVANSPSNIVSLVFSATQQNFHIANLVNPATESIATASPTPGGYLNLLGVANRGPIQGVNDITAATTVYYTPYHGNQIPVWNGVSFTVLNFPELQLALSSSAQSASTIYDVCIFNNAGSPVAVFSPAWATSSVGSSTRGTGAGTPQLTYQSGLLVNAASFTGNNGSNTYTIPALECTYVGSVFVDAVAGVVSNYRTIGQSRKYGVWNNYNRVQICLQVSDPTTDWQYDTGTFRASDNNTANSLTTFTGLAEEIAQITFNQTLRSVFNSNNYIMYIGIGVNSTTSYSGLIGSFSGYAASSGQFALSSVQASYPLFPQLGVNTITALEQGGGGGELLFYGGTTYMLLKACWNG